MQKTEWIINQPVYDVLVACIDNSYALGKLPVNPEDIPLPPKPFDIATNKEAKTKWKREASNVYKERAKAKSKFDVWPSAYGSAWASKWYKEQGGGWRKKVEEDCGCDHIIEEAEYQGKKVKLNDPF